MPMTALDKWRLRTREARIATMSETAQQVDVGAAKASEKRQPSKILKVHKGIHNIPAGGQFKKTFNVSKKDHPKYGTEIMWDFKSEGDYDIDFTLAKDGKPVQAPLRCISNKGTLVIPSSEKCQVIFHWDNTFSWLNSKDLAYTIQVLLPEDVEAREVELEKKRQEAAAKKEQEEKARKEEEDRRRAEQAAKESALFTSTQEECAKLDAEITAVRTSLGENVAALITKREEAIAEINRNFQSMQEKLAEGVAAKKNSMIASIDSIQKYSSVLTDQHRVSTDDMISGLRQKVVNDLDPAILAAKFEGGHKH